MKQQAIYKIIGMQKDVADSGMDNQHAFDIHNMRLRGVDTNTLSALVNEQGNIRAIEGTLAGKVIGFGTINNKAILFTHQDIDGSSPAPATTVNGVICDYPEERSTKHCDHIYIVEAHDLPNNQPAHDGTDCSLSVTEFFSGDLGFSFEAPIECTTYFENEEIQKVYWVDGIHQLRYANIAGSNAQLPITDNLMFDSVPMLHLQESASVTRNSTGGVFPSGTVQWCFTYLNRYGAESNIAWVSPLYYSSPDDRGGAPGEMCANSFTISIRNYEPKGRFDYIRLYHIVHTSTDTQPEVRRVADIAVPDGGSGYSDIVFTDTNTTGEIIDNSELMYLGGTSIIPQTLEQKSNTLFLGNLKQETNYLCEAISSLPDNAFDSSVISFRLTPENESAVPVDNPSGYYSYQHQLLFSSYDITSFRRGEKYRFGFQAQDKTGKWSDVLWLGDELNDSVSPVFSTKLQTVQAFCTFNSTIVNTLISNGFVKVRPVVVYPEPWERNIFTEGLLNPTVYNVKDRSGNSPFAQSSWFIRPFPPIDLGGASFENVFANVNITLDEDGNYCRPGVAHYPFSEHTISSEGVVRPAMSQLFSWNGEVWRWFGSLAIDSVSGYDFSNLGAPAEYRHNYPLGDSQQRNGEIQSMYNYRPGYKSASDGLYNVGGYIYKFPYVLRNEQDYSYHDNCSDFVNIFSDFFYVDQSILTMNSADIEFDQILQAQKLSDFSFKVIGYVPITSFVSSYDITTKTAPNKFYRKDNDAMQLPVGLYNIETVGASMFNDCVHGYKSFINGAIWHDDLAWSTVEFQTNGAFPAVMGSTTAYENDHNFPIGFAVYPWHGTGSLNNDNVGSRKVFSEDNAKETKNLVSNNYISAELKSKILANLHYSYKTYYAPPTSCLDIPAVSKIVLDTQQVSLTKLDDLSDIEGTKFSIPNYFGTVDKLITPISSVLKYPTRDTNEVDWNIYPMTRKGGYPIMASYLPYYGHTRTYDNQNHIAFSYPYSPIGVHNTLVGDPLGSQGVAQWKMKEGSDKKMSSIPIKYKSCNHIVIALDYVDNKQHYLGWNGFSSVSRLYADLGLSSLDTVPDVAPFWDAENLLGQTSAQLFDNASIPGVEIHNDSEHHFSWITFDDYPQGFLYMGMLYRDDNTVENKFGGDSEEALEQNQWLPAGEAVHLSSNSTVELVWQAGDTYYQRYDALRTYPFTEDDVNKVVDIVSFMTETHTNIDGRYDINRGLSNNNHCRPQNFNKLNYVYSQRDNFFTYHSINPKKVHLNVFEYSFVYSLMKTAGSLRDEWTHITLASSYDCDGNKGPLNRITRLDNNLVAFQSNGVAQILFNENVQLQASEGLPIELANSGKLQGLRYYTTETGCQNKWSVSVMPNGIYWIDGRVKEFYVLSEGISQLSTTKLMSTWFHTNKATSGVWNPSSWSGFLSLHDSTTGELFLTSGTDCLCFDTLAGEFTSFYDYNETSAMFTIGGHVITAARDKSSNNANDTLWLHRRSKVSHCNFYGVQYPFWVEVICNNNNQSSDYGMEKIFDNMSWRSDAWSWEQTEAQGEYWRHLPFVTFTSLEGFTNYQTFSCVFDRTSGQEQTSHPLHPYTSSTMLNLRKKFNVWYTTIPRSNESSANTYRDRIRDKWCHVKLTASTDVSYYKYILHDLSVTYFIP